MGDEMHGDDTPTHLPPPGELARQWLRTTGARRGQHVVVRSGLGEWMRSCVLAELHLTGRIEDAGSLSLDTSPTGDGAVDEFLRCVNDHPNRTIDRLIRRGPLLTDEVVASLLADRTWRRAWPWPRVYRELQPETKWFPADTTPLRIASGKLDADPWQTTLAILLHPSDFIPDSAYDRSGAAGPLLRSFVSMFGYDQAVDRVSGQWNATNNIIR